MAVDARTLRTECIYQGQGPLGSLVDDVAQIGTVIAACQGHRRAMRRWSGVCLLGAVALSIAGFLIDSSLNMVLAVFAFVAAIGLFIYSFIDSRRLVKHSNRHDLLKQLLAIVQQDSDTSAPFSIRLSLAAAPQLLSETAWTARKNGKQRLFRESWMKVEGPLLDGTTVTQEVTELLRKRTFTNPNGKRKTKTRSRYLVNVRFAYEKDQYGDVRDAQAKLHESVPVPPSAMIRGVRVSEKAVLIKGLVQFEYEIAQTATALSLGAYRILNRARRGAAK